MANTASRLAERFVLTRFDFGGRASALPWLDSGRAAGGERLLVSRRPCAIQRILRESAARCTLLRLLALSIARLQAVATTSSDQCRWANDGECDQPPPAGTGACDAGTDVDDCALSHGCVGDTDGFSALLSSAVTTTEVRATAPASRLDFGAHCAFCRRSTAITCSPPSSAHAPWRLSSSTTTSRSCGTAAPLATGRRPARSSGTSAWVSTASWSSTWRRRGRTREAMLSSPGRRPDHVCQSYNIYATNFSCLGRTLRTPACDNLIAVILAAALV